MIAEMIVRIAGASFSIVVAILLIFEGVKEWKRGWKYDGVVAFLGAAAVILSILLWLYW